MKTAEIFCGTKSFSKVAEELGHKTFTVDNNQHFEPDVICDVRDLNLNNPNLQNLDILWCSPPCQGFSVAAIGKNWNKNYTPKTDSARLGMELVEATLKIIETLKPKWFFIENPRAMLRKLPHLQHLRRVTVTYCQYGDTRQKPTDIWTNVPAEIWSPTPPVGPVRRAMLPLLADRAQEHKV